MNALILFRGMNFILSDNLLLKGDVMKKCNWCNETKPADDYYTKSSGKLMSYCKACVISQCAIRHRKIKLQAIEYKGGKCERCGFIGCPAAFDFHHLDPSIKDEAVVKRMRKAFTAEARQELDKCILVCSNCHRTIHYEQVNVEERIRPANKYRRRDLHTDKQT